MIAFLKQLNPNSLYTILRIFPFSVQHEILELEIHINIYVIILKGLDRNNILK